MVFLPSVGSLTQFGEGLELVACGCDASGESFVEHGQAVVALSSSILVKGWIGEWCVDWEARTSSLTFFASDLFSYVLAKLTSLGALRRCRVQFWCLWWRRGVVVFWTVIRGVVWNQEGFVRFCDLRLPDSVGCFVFRSLLIAVFLFLQLVPKCPFVFRVAGWLLLCAVCCLMDVSIGLEVSLIIPTL